MLPSCVASSPVHESGDRLGNRSGDASQEIAIRWKNGVRMLQCCSLVLFSVLAYCLAASLCSA